MAQNSINNTFLGVGAQDAFNIYQNATPTTYAKGIDTSDADTLKITTGANPSAGTTLWSMTTSGAQSLPLQPQVLAYRSANAPNVTGAGATYQIVFDVEASDPFNQYNPATGLFTAAFGGKYLFQYVARLTNLTVANTAAFWRIDINGGSNLAYGSELNPGPIISSNSGLIQSAMAIAAVGPGGTLAAQVQVNGGVGNTVGVDGLGGTNLVTALFVYFLG